MTHSLPTRALDEHGAFVRRLAQELLRDEASVDDAVQDTWLSFLRRPPADDHNTRGWLATVLVNRVRSRHRAAQRRAEREAAAARHDVVDAASAAVERMELRQRVVSAVLALPEPPRRVILLAYDDGLSAAEIARRLGVPAGTVRSQISRALVELRRKLDEGTGGRAAWSAALVALVRHRRVVGGTVKLAAAAVLGGGAVVAGAWVLGSGPTEPAAPNGASSGVARVWAAGAGRKSDASDADPSPAVRTRIDPSRREEPVRTSAAQDPDLAALSTPQLTELALWIQHLLRLRLLTPDPDQVGGELARMRGTSATGATRILRRDASTNEPIGVRGGGAYFSFVSRSHSYDDQPDVSLEEGRFTAGFYGGTAAYLLDLGDLALADLAPQGPANLAIRDRGAYEHFWRGATDARGDVDPEFTARAQRLGLQSSLPALVGHTYLLRSIPLREHDVLVAFRSVAADETGHTLVWRVLHTFGVFAEPRSTMPRAPLGETPRWILGKSAVELLALLDAVRARATPRLLAVSPRIVNDHAALLAGADTGACRILPRGRFLAVVTLRGAGAYYDFLTRSNDYNDHPHIGLEQGSFSSGFAGGDRGLVVDLGDVPLDAALRAREADGWTRDAVAFLSELVPERMPDGGKRMKDADYQTARERGYLRAAARPGHTYLLRCVQEVDDLLVAFRVVACDDDGATLLWRIVARR